MAESFSKLFSSILESTIWQEPDHVRILWIAFLAMCNRKGEVYGSIPGLSNRARITIPQVEEALARFMSPDRYSRTKDFEGRRIQEIEGGWLIINYAKHRKVLDEEAIKESKRDYMRRIRAEGDEEEETPPTSTHSTVEDSGKNRSVSASASEDMDRGTGKGKEKKPAFSPPQPDEASGYCQKLGMPTSEADRFMDYYSANGWRVGKNPMKDWQAAMRNWKKNYEERNGGTKSSSTPHRPATQAEINALEKKLGNRGDDSVHYEYFRAEVAKFNYRHDKSIAQIEARFAPTTPEDVI